MEKEAEISLNCIWIGLLIILMCFGIPIETHKYVDNDIVVTNIINNSYCGKTIHFARKSKLSFATIEYIQIESLNANIRDDINVSKIKFGETKVKITYHNNLITGLCYNSSVFIDKIEEVK